MWSLRFRVSAARDAIEILSPLSEGEHREPMHGDDEVAAATTLMSSMSKDRQVFDTDGVVATHKGRSGRL